ncbi:methanogenesis marker 17 protein [Methanonatronarchaeum sp. AMET-Sl]|uniref:methanogenesis marker 17 protein n=1 Tax=Methanonatronarchaeum sp. AMET-Sl TaxID=3037654 RepID=UPI00244DDE2B|nr:methanogenesis marker 17 protein [Methanonatronarchaeum sp. AMET-Sl]WGI16946.1 methanogenesis marker 17 protein [Methanonatronarchaeum sp. AMET-Sl]
MKITVESPTNDEGAGYKDIARDIIRNSRISSLVEHIHMVIEVKEPIFIISIKVKGIREPIKIKNIAKLRDTEEGCTLEIRDEGYASNLLSKLWKEFGKSNVEQPTRLEIICKDIKKSEIEDMVLTPSEEITDTLLNLSWQIIPEGFRVRRSLKSKKVFTILATEEPMEEKWIERLQKTHNKITEA